MGGFAVEWGDQSGPVSRATLGCYPGLLVIRQTRANQRVIEAVLHELERLLADKQPATRHQAFEALANLLMPPFFPAAPVSGPDSERLTSILRRSVEHEDPQIAAAATILVDMWSTSLPPGAEGIP